MSKGCWEAGRDHWWHDAMKDASEGLVTTPILGFFSLYALRRLGRRKWNQKRASDLTSGFRRMRGGVDGRRGPPLYALHLGVDRKTQGRPSHHSRIHAIRSYYLQVFIRLPGSKRIFYYCGPPQLTTDHCSSWGSPASLLLPAIEAIKAC